MYKAIGKFRRLLYRSGSILGDVQAISSGKPEKMLKRFLRKVAHRKMGGAINRTIR